MSTEERAQLYAAAGAERERKRQQRKERRAERTAVTVKQGAEIIGRKESAVSSAIHSGRLPAKWETRQGRYVIQLADLFKTFPRDAATASH
jgi:hypothetical protein